MTQLRQRHAALEHVANSPVILPNLQTRGLSFRLSELPNITQPAGSWTAIWNRVIRHTWNAQNLSFPICLMGILVLPSNLLPLTETVNTTVHGAELVLNESLLSKYLEEPYIHYEPNKCGLNGGKSIQTLQNRILLLMSSRCSWFLQSLVTRFFLVPSVIHLWGPRSQGCHMP